MTTFHSTRPPFTSYSSFFASGLLAPHTPRTRTHRSDTICSDLSNDSDSYSCPPSPSCPSSPGLPDSSTMDVDMNDFARRSATPTPHTQNSGHRETTPIQSRQPSKAATSTQLQPRLRRRRSSLTQAASPMAGIRSPTRAAGDAFRLQNRARSGSLGGDQAVGSIYGGAAVMTIATEATSLLGRMRSGSCSNAAVPNVGAGTASATALTMRTRRGARRGVTTPVPAPRAPPPNAPLPALPQQQLRPAKINLNVGASPPSTTANDLKQIPATSARARGLSVSSSALSGDENRIDEEMKEN